MRTLEPHNNAIEEVRTELLSSSSIFWTREARHMEAVSHTHSAEQHGWDGASIILEYYLCSQPVLEVSLEDPEDSDRSKLFS